MMALTGLNARGYKNSTLLFNLARVFIARSNARAIITHLSMDYLKKARGPITAECRCERPDTTVRGQHELTAELTDEQGTLVARAHARWLVGPS